MGSKWIEVKLSDLGEVARGRSRHRPRYAEHLYGGPYPFIQTGDITGSGGRIINHSQTYSEAGLEQSRLWPKNTMCITIAANIAETAVLQYPACFPDSVIGFIADEEKCDVYFIEYVFRCLKRSIQRQASGSVQDNINLQTLERLIFKIPELQEQQKIAAFLNKLEDKITLNRQINQTLEQMAQTLFKSWFVDFDPVIDNALDAGNDIPDTLQDRAEQRRLLRAKADFKPLPAETRALFPSEFEETELGWVPKGWEVLSLNLIAKMDTTSVNPSSKPDLVWEHYSIPAFDKTRLPSLDTGETIKSNKYKVSANSILVSKLNPQTQRIWWVDPINEKNAICSTEFMQFIPLNENQRPFLYFLLASEPFQENILKTVTGTTGSRQRAQPTQVAESIILKPSEQLIKKFSEQAINFMKKIDMNLKDDFLLSELRDCLLPKLISGELALNDLPEDVAEAAEVL